MALSYRDRNFQSVTVVSEAWTFAVFVGEFGCACMLACMYIHTYKQAYIVHVCVRVHVSLCLSVYIFIFLMCECMHVSVSSSFRIAVIPGSAMTNTITAGYSRKLRTGSKG